jgi:hypothetical protein
MEAGQPKEACGNASQAAQKGAYGGEAFLGFV